MVLDPEGWIAQNTGIAEAIPCKEQLLNRESNGVVEAWPAGTLSIRPAVEEEDEPVGEDPKRMKKMAERNVCWALADQEMAISYPHDPSDFGDEEGSGRMTSQETRTSSPWQKAWATWTCGR